MCICIVRERKSYWSVVGGCWNIRGTNPENNTVNDKKKDSTSRLCAIIYDPSGPSGKMIRIERWKNKISCLCGYEIFFSTSGAAWRVTKTAI